MGAVSNVANKLGTADLDVRPIEDASQLNNLLDFQVVKTVCHGENRARPSDTQDIIWARDLSQQVGSTDTELFTNEMIVVLRGVHDAPTTQTEMPAKLLTELDIHRARATDGDRHETTRASQYQEAGRP